MTKSMYNANYRAKHRLKIKYLAEAYARTERGKERREAARMRYREKKRAEKAINNATFSYMEPKNQLDIRAMEKNISWSSIVVDVEFLLSPNVLN